MKYKRAKACIDALNALLQRSDLEPEQRLEVERCRDRVRKLCRTRNPSQAEIFDCINKVSQGLINALRKK